jgi:hypothetical protein
MHYLYNITILNLSTSAISCFFCDLRQLKMVKPNCQSGGGNEQALKNKTAICMLDIKHDKDLFDLFHLSTKEILNKK